MKTEQSPKALTLVCNDWGVVDEIIRDDLGLPPVENEKAGKMAFLHLADQPSQAKARAFLAELRIAHKVVDQEFSIQTTNGVANVYFAGVKSDGQFIIVAAETSEYRDKLYTEVLSVVSENERQKHLPDVKQLPSKKTPAETGKKHGDLADPHKELAQKHEELEKLRQDFYELATSDSLTGLYNRRHFLKRMREELHESERYKRSTVFMVVDIDHIGVINGKYGFETGDEVIRALGQLIRVLLRNVDLVGRLGSDEFGALLLETTLASSVVIAKRLQKRMMGIAIEFEGHSFYVTVSIALIAIGTGKSEANKLLKLAEKRLEKARENGGNQIIQE
jgi:diguanylate cyclase (GGDEF)-like protein